MLSQVYWSRAHSTEMARLPAEPPKAPFAFSVHFSADRGLERYNQVNKEEDTSFKTRATLARPLSTVAAKNSGTAYLPTIPKKCTRYLNPFAGVCKESEDLRHYITFECRRNERGVSGSAVGHPSAIGTVQGTDPLA